MARGAGEAQVPPACPPPRGLGQPMAEKPPDKLCRFSRCRHCTLATAGGMLRCLGRSQDAGAGPPYPGWEEMWKRITRGGLGVPTLSPPPLRTRRKPRVGMVPLCCPGVTASCSGSSRGGRCPPTQEPEGLRVCQHRCQARQWLPAPACSAWPSGPGMCCKHLHPLITPLAGRDSCSLWGLHPPPPALGVPASVVLGEGVSGGDGPMAPQPFGGCLSSAGFQSHQKALGRAAGAPWDLGEREMQQPPGSRGCRELALMLVKPLERGG